MKRKIFFIGLIILLIVGGAVWYLGRADKTEPQSNDRIDMSEPAANKPEKIRIIANGDLLPHDSINQQAKTQAGYDYQKFFKEVSDVYKSADIRFCNQEVPSAGQQYGISGYPVFNAPEKFASDINQVGCNLINLANNHINDKGQGGINETRRVWDGLDSLAVAGANRNEKEKEKVAYFEIKGVKFAFVAYTEISNNPPGHTFSLNRLDEALVAPQLSQAKKNADIVLVSVHWGTEYSPDINQSQKNWAKKFADYGADIVLGTGPHVIEPVEKLPKNGGGHTVVFYSLGNLLSTQLDIESLIGGFAVIEIDAKTKVFDRIGFLPTYMHYEWTAEQKAREDLLARKNLKIFYLQQASEPLSRSQNNTSVPAQTSRIKEILNRYTKVDILEPNLD